MHRHCRWCRLLSCTNLISYADTGELALHQARCLTHACLDVNDTVSAAWYADKACSLGGGNPSDLFNLATVYYKSGEFHRALTLLEHHGLVDLDAQSNNISTKRKPLASVHDNAKTSLAEQCTVPPLYHGAVRPESLRYFHLAATCLASLGQWERCVVLLEGCMEGPGRAGLRVPLKVPAPDVATHLLPSLQQPGSSTTDAATKGNATSTRSKDTSSAGNATKPGSAPAEWAPFAGLDGVPSGGAGEENYEPSMASTAAAGTGTKGGSTPSRTRSATAAMRAAASASTGAEPMDALDSTLAAGLAVWHVIRHMALQHSEQVAVACGRDGHAGITLHVPGALFSSGFVPCGSGLGAINIVAALCNVRGKALLALENRLRAAQWFIAALRCDPYCASALHSLIDNSLLSCQEEERLCAYLQAVLSPVSSRTAQPGQGEMHQVHVGYKALLAARMYSDVFKSGVRGTATSGPIPASVGGEGRTRQGSVDSQGTQGSTGTAHSHASTGAHASSASLLRTKSGRVPPSTGSAAALSTSTGTAGGSGLPSASRAAGPGGKSTPASHSNSRSSSVDASDPVVTGMSSIASTTGVAVPVPAQAGTLRMSVHLGWLRDLYCCRLGRYSLATPLQGRFYPLEHSDHCRGLGTAGVGRIKANLDVQTAKAEALHAQQDYEGAYSLTKAVLAVDPYHPQACLVHYTLLVALRKAPELFAMAHKAVHAYPKAALSWYAVGCYYLCLGRLPAASRHFMHATSCDKSFASAWIGLGLAYAGQEEIEPSLQAYRAALRLAPNSHIAPLAMASICTKTNSLALARQYLEIAYARCPYDPLVYHEVGVLEWRKGGKDAVMEATKYWEEALKLISGLPAHTRTAHEATYFCLGHAYRKLGLYEDSIEAYTCSLALQPGKPSTLAALAFVNLLAGHNVRAVELCHAVLAQGTDDPFVSKVLRCALGEVLDAPPTALVVGMRAPTATALAKANALAQRISKIMSAADSGSLQLPLVQGANSTKASASAGGGAAPATLHRSAMDISAIAGGVGASMILGVTGIVGAPGAGGSRQAVGRPGLVGAGVGLGGPSAGPGRGMPGLTAMHDHSQVLSELHEGDVSLSSTPGSGMVITTPEATSTHGTAGGVPSVHSAAAQGSYGRMTTAGAPGVGRAMAPPAPPALPRRGAAPVSAYTPAPAHVAGGAGAGGAGGGRAGPAAAAAGISPIPDFSAIISPDATGASFSLGMTGTRLWDTSGASTTSRAVPAQAQAQAQGQGRRQAHMSDWGEAGTSTPAQGQPTGAGRGRAHMPGSSSGGRFSLDRELAGIGVQMVSSPELCGAHEGEDEDEELAHSAFRSAHGDQGPDSSTSGMDLEMSDYELAARLQQEEMAGLAATQHNMAAAAAAARTPGRNVSVRNMSARRVQSITPTDGRVATQQGEGEEEQAAGADGEEGAGGQEVMLDYASLPVIPGYTPEEVAQLIASGAFDDMGFGEDMLGEGSGGEEAEGEAQHGGVRAYRDDEDGQEEEGQDDMELEGE